MPSYLIRVGLDSTTDGGEGLAPIASSGEFDYVPIPEQCASEETRTYDEIERTLNVPVEDFVGVDSNSVLHFDPEFDTFTYGEVGHQKCNALRKLKKGDLLIFCAGLSPMDANDRPRMYAIGYFTVKQAYDLEDLTPKERADILDGYPNNAHVKRAGLTTNEIHPDDDDRNRFPVIVVGDPERSRLLERASPLSSSTATGTGLGWYVKYRPLGVVNDLFGLNATDLKRSNPKKVRGDTDSIRRWLGGNREIEASRRYSAPKYYFDDESESGTQPGGTPKLRSYVVHSDSGFAPHVQKGLLTLCTCKPMIRSSSKPGDWVVGFGGSNHQSESQLVYAFRVGQTLLMREYFLDERYAHRIPLNDDRDSRGDNIYAPRDIVDDIETVDGSSLPDGSDADAETLYKRGYVDGELCYTYLDGDYFQLHRGGHDLGNYKQDIERQGNREKVLLSADFYYFGSDGPEVPEHIADRFVPGHGEHNGRRGHRTEPTPGRVDDITPIINYIRNNFRPGIHGQPASSSVSLDPSETSGPGC